MTHTAAHPLAQVAELDEERRRYESWLSQLDARRDASPEHVYARVRADYEGRLQGVLARLAEHAETLRHAVDDVGRRVADLHAREQQRRDERAEAELRTLVGEYTAEQWNDIQAVSDEELAQLGGERHAAEQELAQLQDMLARATTPSAAITPPSAGAAVTGAAAEPRLATPPGGEIVFPTPASATPVGPLAGEVIEEPAPPPVRQADVRPADADLAPAEDLAAWSRGLDETVAPGLGRSPTPGEATYAVGDDSSPQIKTLKCQECGTMNYPTEWYCERCGGELATL